MEQIEAAVASEGSGRAAARVVGLSHARVHQRLQAAGKGVERRPPTRRPPKVSLEQIEAAVARTGSGNAADRELGLSLGTASDRLRKAGKGLGHRPPKVSLEQIEAAVARTGSGYAAARLLGLSRPAMVNERLRKAGKGMRGRRPKVTLQQIEDAVAREGSGHAAARVLGLSNARVHQRLRAAGKGLGRPRSR